MTALNETYAEQSLAALLPLEGSSRLGEGLFDLNTYLLHFCFLLCGTHQPSLWFVVSLKSSALTAHLRAHTHTHTDTFSWINTHKYTQHQKGANLRGSEMNVLARKSVWYRFRKCLDRIHVPLKKNTSMCYVFQQVQRQNSYFYFFLLPKWLICLAFTVRQICKLLPFLHPDVQSHNYSKLEQSSSLKQNDSQLITPLLRIFKMNRFLPKQRRDAVICASKKKAMITVRVAHLTMHSTHLTAPSVFFHVEISF